MPLPPIINSPEMNAAIAAASQANSPAPNRRPRAPITRAEAARRIGIYATDSRLIQNEAWHVVRDGKNLASLCGAIDMNINTPDDVPDHIMPPWLVSLVTTLADGVPPDALPDHAQRFAKALDSLLPQSPAQDTVALEAIRQRFLTHLPQAYSPPDDEYNTIARVVAGLWGEAAHAHQAAAAPRTNAAQAAKAACEAVAWAAVQSAVRDALNTAGDEAKAARAPAFSALFDALIEEMGK